MFAINKKRIAGLCMALTFVFASAIPAFAAEPNLQSEIPADSVEIIDETNSEAQPCGTLSGYRSIDLSGEGDKSFIVDVNGMSSAWAGCTLKTSGFSSEATLDITVKYGDTTMCHKILGPNSEARNIALWGVSSGGYTVEVTIKNNTNTGNLQIWIY